VVLEDLGRRGQYGPSETALAKLQYCICEMFSAVVVDEIQYLALAGAIVSSQRQRRAWIASVRCALLERHRKMKIYNDATMSQTTNGRCIMKLKVASLS
jgi:hypothetical protein